MLDNLAVAERGEISVNIMGSDRNAAHRDEAFGFGEIDESVYSGRVNPDWRFDKNKPWHFVPLCEWC
jgi:hypothetical protein